jgi:hypothetical protein
MRPGTASYELQAHELRGRQHRDTNGLDEPETPEGNRVKPSRGPVDPRIPDLLPRRYSIPQSPPPTRRSPAVSPPPPPPPPSPAVRSFVIPRSDEAVTLHRGHASAPLIIGEWPVNQSSRESPGPAGPGSRGVPAGARRGDANCPVVHRCAPRWAVGVDPARQSPTRSPPRAVDRSVDVAYGRQSPDRLPPGPRVGDWRRRAPRLHGLRLRNVGVGVARPPLGATESDTADHGVIHRVARSS